jgi:preprotein translocase subunit SecD
MRLLNYLLILTTSLTLFTSSISLADTQTKHGPVSISFQVIQDQLNIDSSMIKSASIITNSNGAYYGLQIELSSSAAKELTHLTTNGVGKIANLVINNKIITSATIRSPLQDKFLITGITRKDAQEIIDSVKNK